MSFELLATIRASAWPALFDCALRYYYQSILGLWTPSTGPQRLGTGWHVATAAFDKARLAGSPITIDDAAGVFVDDLKRDADSVLWDAKLSRRDAESIGLSLTTRYCTTIAPFRKYSAVEVQCEALEVETPHGIIRLTGTSDRVRTYDNGTEGVGDLKSGKRAVVGITEARPRANIAAHHLQIGVYTIMSEHALGRRLTGPSEIIGAQTSKASPIVAAAQIADARTPLIGDAQSPGLIVMAAAMLKSGIFPPNPRSQLCSKRYCAGWGICKYRAREFDDEREPDVV